MRELIDRYIEAYNAFDVDGMMAVLHPGIEFRNVAGGETTASASGADEFRQLAEQSTALFVSRRQVVTTLQILNGVAQAEISYEAVLATDLPNGMKAGETLRLQGRSEFTVRDGLIVRIVDRSA